MNPRPITAVVATFLILAVAGAGTPTPQDAPTAAPSFEWKRSTPESQGVDSEMLLRSIRRIRDENLDVRSLVLVRNDHVILELYVHPYTRNTVHNVKSVSKSILSALVGILTDTSGESALDFANEHLFGPLSFGTLQWTRGPQGYYFGGSELFLRTRDMAKFGLLYLHGGVWRGRQIVPADWVRESTGNRLPAGAGVDYGYWWWVEPDGGGYRALGWGGQRITVRPDLHLVVASTAGDPTAADRMFRDFDFTAMGDEPLPPNPDAVTALGALVRELELATRIPHSASAATARSIRSGRT